MIEPKAERTIEENAQAVELVSFLYWSFLLSQGSEELQEFIFKLAINLDRDFFKGVDWNELRTHATKLKPPGWHTGNMDNSRHITDIHSHELFVRMADTINRLADATPSRQNNMLTTFTLFLNRDLQLIEKGRKRPKKSQNTVGKNGLSALLNDPKASFFISFVINEIEIPSHQLQLVISEFQRIFRALFSKNSAELPEITELEKKKVKRSILKLLFKWKMAHKNEQPTWISIFKLLWV